MISYFDLAQKRYSCRHFEQKPLDAAHRASLQALITDPGAVPFSTPVRFHLIIADEVPAEAYKKLGTYGFIRGARAFLAGAVQTGPDHPMALEDFGYAFERLILAVTGMNLGTCWLGASFTKSRFAGQLILDENEIIPAISPVGYPAPLTTVRERMIRWSIDARRRKPWHDLFFHGWEGNPLLPQAAGLYQQALEMVRIAPSGSNRQPWRIVKESGHSAYHFYCDAKPPRRINDWLGVVDIPRLDMGIAMFHFEAGARELGLAGNWLQTTPVPTIQTDSWRYVATWLDESRSIK